MSFCVKGLSYSYPTSKSPVLKDLNFDIKKGQLTALIGNNGCGKTTLCSILRGFIPQFYKGNLSGEISLDGKELSTYSSYELASKVGYVFQNPFTQVSGVKDNVFDELAYGLENLGVDEQSIIKRCEEMLALLKIAHLRDRHPQSLSGGQRQMLALGSIIIMEPEILIIDEPTSQLDPEASASVFDVIKLMKEKGKTIILSEHKMDLLARYADDFLLLHEGEIVLKGSAAEVFSQAQGYDVLVPHVSELAWELTQQGRALNFFPIKNEELAQSIAHA